MNIDFHYGVVYVAARLGGLPANDAQTVAHACQYVDDATTSGLLRFADGETFEHFATAHKLFDYENVWNDQNRLVWAPFHFLPAGEGRSLDERAVCRPNSAVAQEVVRRALNCRAKENALHRLGVTLHSYVDTWAHQGFAGIECDYNRVSHLEAEDCSKDEWITRLENATKHLVQNVESDLLTRAFPLGHGAALHYPDQPWANWQYVNGKNETVRRANLDDFVSAADMVCRAIQAFVARTEDFTTQPGLSVEPKDALRNLLATSRSEDENVRLEVIRDSVHAGLVPGLREQIPVYIGKGVGSWKYAATGIEVDGDGPNRPVWSEVFERSDYRLFHDAVKEHRFVVT
jgi:hypothetical protein